METSDVPQTHAARKQTPVDKYKHSSHIKTPSLTLKLCKNACWNVWQRKKLVKRLSYRSIWAHCSRVCTDLFILYAQYFMLRIKFTQLCTSQCSDEAWRCDLYNFPIKLSVRVEILHCRFCKRLVHHYVKCWTIEKLTKRKKVLQYISLIHLWMYVYCESRLIVLCFHSKTSETEKSLIWQSRRT